MAVSERLLAGLTVLLLALSTAAQYQGRPTGILASDRCGAWGKMHPLQARRHLLKAYAVT